MLDKYKLQLNNVNKINSNQMLGMFHLKLHLLKNVTRPTCNLLLELVEATLVRYEIIHKNYRCLVNYIIIHFFFIEWENSWLINC